MNALSVFLIMAMIEIALPEKILTCNSVDKLEIGMHKEEVLHLYGHDNAKINPDYPKGMEARIIEIYQNENLSFVTDLQQDTIWRITVFDNSYKTRDNVSVGTSYSDLKNIYPVTLLFFRDINMYAESGDICFSFSFGPLNDSIPPESEIKHIVVKNR